MAVYKRGGVWWYKFNWNGETIRASTKQGNKRVAEQIESAHRTSLAKGEVGIREKRPAPTLADFAKRDFLPFVEANFAAKIATARFYRNGVKSLLADTRLSGLPLDKITSESVAGFISKRQTDGLQVTSINRELQVLRRMLHLAVEWGRLSTVPPKVRMLPGERHRERVLTEDEEARYLRGAVAVGDRILAAYRAALKGIRATQRGQEPIPPSDPYILRDIAIVLIDCGIRPEECFRLRWEQYRDGAIEILNGKTANARRRIPVSKRVAAVLDMRRATAASEWIFPAPTKSGHAEPSTIKKHHLKACKGDKTEPDEWEVEPFPLYTLRHTCLTRWSRVMDPWTLAYLAGHRDMSITRRYVHPRDETIREALEKVQGAQTGHNFGHSGRITSLNDSEDSTAIN